VPYRIPVKARERKSVNGAVLRRMARRDFLANAALVGGTAFLAPWASPAIAKAYPIGPAEESPTGFDPKFALDVAIPLALAA